MHRLLVCIFTSSLLATAGIAQEPESEDAATAEEAVETDDAAPAEEEQQEPLFDETGLDEQGFDNQDDDFRPSEDIPADQSIPFPTDI